jgi:hypothetical protein
MSQLSGPRVVWGRSMGRSRWPGIGAAALTACVSGCSAKTGDGIETTFDQRTGPSCEYVVALPRIASTKSYDTFYRAHFGSRHLTCPFDYRAAENVRVLVDHQKSGCGEQVLPGLQIVKREQVSGFEAEYRRCSNTLSGSRDTLVTSSGVDAYVWREPGASGLTSDPHHAETDRLGYQVSIAVLYSGLPFVNYLPSNMGLCFEERAGTNLSPRDLLRGIGIAMPSWEVENVMRGKTCDEVFGSP